MPKNKLTLLIDGNWLLMSRLSVLLSKYVDDDKLVRDLKQLVTHSIKLVLKQFPQIDNIMMCVDGGSWRTKIDNSQILDIDGNVIEYKGTREKSEDVNWDMIFNAYNELCELYKKYNINVYRELDVEGDDWIWYWSTRLNNEGTNCIIWSKDNDLKQLVNINKDKCFTVWWNKDTGIFAPEHSTDDFNFLFNIEYDTNAKLFNDIIKNQPVTQINKNEIVLDKIIRGDKSDNIAPIIIRKPKTPSSKIYRISSKDIDFDLNYNNDEDVVNFITEIFNSKKYHNKIYENSVNDIYKHFLYNKQLVYLDESSYPEYILDLFNQYKDYNVSTDIDSCEAEIIAQNNKLYNILNII